MTPAAAAGQTVVVNPRGFKTTYDFDTKFRTTGITDDNGGVTTFTYGSSNNVTCVTDQRGKKTSYSYDSKGNVTQMIDALNTDANCALKAGGVKWTYTYTPKNDIDTVTEPPIPPDAQGRSTQNIYNTPGNLTRIVRKDAGGAVKALACLERDASGQMTASVQSTNLTVPPGPTDPCTGNRTAYGYDTYGNQTCILNATLAATGSCFDQIAKAATFEYDLGGRVLYSTPETTNVVRKVKGQAPETGVSGCGPLGTGDGENDDPADDAVADDGCPSTKYTYDAQNNVVEVMDGLGNVATSAYDAKGNLISVKDANRKTAGATPETGSAQCGVEGTGDGENDDSGDDTVIDDGCLSVAYKYDNGDRLEKVVQAAVNTTSIPTTSYGYDGNGNRISVTNPKRQTAGASPETGTAQCGAAGTGDNENDDSGDDGIVDDGCPSTKYAYDNLDRLQSVAGAIDYLGRVAVTSYQYDAASNLTQRTDARNLVTKYFPDDMNRLDLIEYWNGLTLVDSVDYTYNAVGFRTRMVDSTGTTDYVPDALDRISSVTFPGPKTVSYLYDDAPGGSAADYPGQRTKITYPDGKYVDYAYRADGLLKTVSDWLGKQTAYTYDYAGRLTEARLPNTTCTAYGYDAADRLTSVVNRRMADPLICAPTDTTISSFSYSLDSVGNRTQMADLSGTHSYVYDALHRLKEVTYPGPQTDTYQYDINGNRAFKNATSYTYDAADQMTATGGVNYGYDANGNQTTRGGDTFSFDHENRLTQTVIGGATSSSVYNGDGLRMSHTASGNTTNYTWDVVAGLPVVLQDGTNTYVYGLDLISATDSGGVQTYFLYDGLGSTTGLTDGSGNNPVSYSYDAFGAIRSQTGSSANYWLYTGGQRDGGSSLYYLRARYYDPAIGRFLSTDPVGAGYPYAYVGNSPVNFVDPSGLHCEAWHPHHCAGEGIDTLGDVYDCARNPARCAVDEFVGSALDKELVNEAGAAAKALANSNSIDKEGGINLIQNCGLRVLQEPFRGNRDAKLRDDRQYYPLQIRLRRRNTVFQA